MRIIRHIAAIVLGIVGMHLSTFFFLWYDRGYYGRISHDPVTVVLAANASGFLLGYGLALINENWISMSRVK